MAKTGNGAGTRHGNQQMRPNFGTDGRIWVDLTDLDGCGRIWMDLDESEQIRMDLDGSGRIWTDLDAFGWI